jgi:UrcA family protein
MLKTLTAVAAAAVAATLLVPTVSEAADTDSVRVSYADLNLASSIGQNTLQRRIVFAARVVCGPADQRDIPFWMAVGECRDGSVADAQPQYEAAVAAALHGTVEVLDGAALIVTAH